MICPTQAKLCGSFGSMFWMQCRFCDSSLYRQTPDPETFSPSKCLLCAVQMQDFPSLILKVQKYTHTDGRTVPLLMAEGTLPMFYQVCPRLVPHLPY